MLFTGKIVSLRDAEFRCYGNVFSICFVFFSIRHSRMNNTGMQIKEARFTSRLACSPSKPGGKVPEKLLTKWTRKGQINFRVFA